MNINLINWVWQQSKVQAPELLVMLALACKADVHGDVTIKLSELAPLCRRPADRVKESLRAIVKAQELEIIQNTDAQGTRTTNTYHFTVCKPVPAPTNGDEITFEDPPSLPGIPPPVVKDLPKGPPPPKVMMDADALAMIAADPTYRGLDVTRQAWKFRRWCEAQVPKRDQTVRAFKVWLSRV